MQLITTMNPDLITYATPVAAHMRQPPSSAAASLVTSSFE